MNRVDQVVSLERQSEELERNLAPARCLLEILRNAAFNWRVNPRSKEDDGCHYWLADLLSNQPEIDDDYRAIDISSAMLLGVADRIEEAFDTLARAVREKAESDREIGGAR